MTDRISPKEAKRLMDADGWVYVDVRSVREFREGHPEGAYNIPLLHAGPRGMEPNPDFLEVVTRTFEPDAKIIVGCKSGGRSARAADLMKASGFEEVVDQRAGYDGSKSPFGQITEEGWAAAGLPTSTQAVHGRSWDELKED